MKRLHNIHRPRSKIKYFWENTIKHTRHHWECFSPFALHKSELILQKFQIQFGGESLKVTSDDKHSHGDFWVLKRPAVQYWTTMTIQHSLTHKTPTTIIGLKSLYSDTLLKLWLLTYMWLALFDSKNLKLLAGYLFLTHFIKNILLHNIKKNI